ncbi:MAG: 5-oxoprolinase subunit PxpB [Thalassobaculales bacterium]
MIHKAPRLLACGTTALTVEFADELSAAANAPVIALDRRIAENPPPGVVEAIPTYRSLQVVYDPCLTDAAELGRALLALAALPAPAAAAAGRLWRVPVSFGGAHGADLAAVAAALELAEAALVERFCAAELTVYMIGFMPGFCYLGGLPAGIAMPRRTDPRASVPGGSVSIGGIQAALVPFDMPSGWHLLGNTPARLLDLGREDPFLIRAGDRVRCFAITAADHAALTARQQAGEWRLEAAA